VGCIILRAGQLGKHWSGIWGSHNGDCEDHYLLECARIVCKKCTDISEGTAASIVRIDGIFVFMVRLPIRMILILIAMVSVTFLQWSERQLLVKRQSENYRYCALSMPFRYCHNVHFSAIFNCKIWFNYINCVVHSSYALSVACAGNTKIRKGNEMELGQLV
jgi:hypothetical protein